MRKELINTD
jgi:hypothetical protein